MFFKVELLPEEEELIIKQIADKIHNMGINTAAVLFFESIRPLALMGGQIGQSFISPFLLLFSENLARSSEKLFITFEKHENLEKLITLIENLERDSENSKKTVKSLKRDVQSNNKKPENNIEKPSTKKGFRRFLPF